MLRGSRDSPSNRYGQQEWDQFPVTRDNSIHGSTPAGYRPFEERPPLRPFGLTSIPMDNPYPTTRVIIVGNNTNHVISPRFPPPSHHLIPRFINQDTTQLDSDSDASNLTKEEQEIVIKKLKKQIYNPMPMILARRVSLYYRDLNRDPNTNRSKAKGKEIDEDKKNCAVCLEDFQFREEVMVTPCNHMFHEECIIPWVKNHGQCPVCRAMFYEKRENGPMLEINRRVVRSSGPGSGFADELFSLIQAVDEVFPWGI